MTIPEESLKKILACIRRLVYDKDVITEKDQEVVEIISELIGERNEH